MTETEYGEAQDFADFFLAMVMNGANVKEAADASFAAFFKDGKWIRRNRSEPLRLSPSQWRPIRDLILERDFYACTYCEKEADEVDHIVPVSRGGSHDDSNLTACCGRCNRSKGAKLLSEWGVVAQ